MHKQIPSMFARTNYQSFVAIIVAIGVDGMMDIERAFFHTELNDTMRIFTFTELNVHIYISSNALGGLLKQILMLQGFVKNFKQFVSQFMYKLLALDQKPLAIANDLPVSTYQYNFMLFFLDM